MQVTRRFDWLLALVAALSLVGCGKTEPAKSGAGEAEAEHHKPPHGGELLELGEEEGHLEVLHDHDGGNITVWVYGSALDKPLSVERPTVTIQTQAGPAEVVLAAMDAKADGTAHQWKAQHDGLKADPWDGRIRLKIGDKTYQSPLEGAGHDHK